MPKKNDAEEETSNTLFGTEIPKKNDSGQETSNTLFGTDAEVRKSKCHSYSA